MAVQHLRYRRCPGSSAAEDCTLVASHLDICHVERFLKHIFSSYIRSYTRQRKHPRALRGEVSCRESGASNSVEQMNKLASTAGCDAVRAVRPHTKARVQRSVSSMLLASKSALRAESWSTAQTEGREAGRKLVRQRSYHTGSAQCT
jgi:hypothetical protein